MVGGLRDVMTCAEFQIEIFMGYDFTGGRIFDFPIDFSMGLTTVQRYCAACDDCARRVFLRINFSWIFFMGKVYTRRLCNTVGDGRYAEKFLATNKQTIKQMYSIIA